MESDKISSYILGYTKKEKALLILFKNSYKTRIVIAMEFNSGNATLHGEIYKKNFFDIIIFNKILEVVSEHDFKLTKKTYKLLQELVNLNEEREYTEYLKMFCK